MSRNYFYAFYNFRHSLTHLVINDNNRMYKIGSQSPKSCLYYLGNFRNLTHLKIMNESLYINNESGVDGDSIMPLVFNLCPKLISLKFEDSFKINYEAKAHDKEHIDGTIKHFKYVNNWKRTEKEHLQQ
jgi:hypothetical protein